MGLPHAIFDEIAASLDYPRKNTADLARAGALKLDLLRSQSATATAQALFSLSSWLGDAPNGLPEERYTRLFDLKPVCTLHAGYHVFGDTYDRGALLSGLAADLKKAGVDFQRDLPDYIPTLLRLLPRCEDEEDRVLLVHALLVPALLKMEPHIAASPDPWASILVSLRPLLIEFFPKGRFEVPALRRPALEVLPC